MIKTGWKIIQRDAMGNWRHTSGIYKLRRNVDLELALCRKLMLSSTFELVPVKYVSRR